MLQNLAPFIVLRQLALSIFINGIVLPASQYSTTQTLNNVEC